MAAVMNDFHLSNGPAIDQARKRLDRALVPIHDRLIAWARWSWQYRELDVPGWPRRNWLARIMRQGAQGASHESRPPIPMPPEIEEVEKAVVEISAKGGIRGRVLRIFYLECSDWPAEAQRGLVHMSARKWERTLGEARVLVGHLLGYEV